MPSFMYTPRAAASIICLLVYGVAMQDLVKHNCCCSISHDGFQDGIAFIALASLLAWGLLTPGKIRTRILGVLILAALGAAAFLIAP